MTDLQAKLNNATGQVSLLTQQLKGLQQDLQQKVDMLMAGQSHVEQLQQQVQAQEQHFATQSSLFQKEKDQMTKHLKRQEERFRKDTAAMETVYREEQAKTASLYKQLQSIQQQLQQLTEQAKAEVTRHRQAAADAQGQLDVLKLQLRCKDSELKQQQGSVGERERLVSEREKALQQKEKELQGLKSELDQVKECLMLLELKDDLEALDNAKKVCEHVWC